jgi:hypothetical protein
VGNLYIDICFFLQYGHVEQLISDLHHSTWHVADALTAKVTAALYWVASSTPD